MQYCSVLNNNNLMILFLLCDLFLYFKFVCVYETGIALIATLIEYITPYVVSSQNKNM